MSSSNLAPKDSLIMKSHYLSQMRQYLSTIYEQFKILYQIQDEDEFAMEIEYKIDAGGRLTIKQARPWAAFGAPGGESLQAPVFKGGFALFPNPASDVLNIQSEIKTDVFLVIHNAKGQKVADQFVDSPKSLGQISIAG